MTSFAFRLRLGFFLGLAAMLGGCITPSRETYLEFSGVVNKPDGTPASGVPIRLYPKSDLRSFALGLAFQDLIPICRLTTDEQGRFEGVVSDFYAYTIEAGDPPKGRRAISRREIKAKTPIKIVVP